MARYTRTSQRRRWATASGKRKTEYRERVYSPVEEDEIDLPEEVWIDEILPEDPPVKQVGMHEKEDLSIERLLEESMPKTQASHIRNDEMYLKTKGYPEKPEQTASTLESFDPSETESPGRDPLYIVVLEVICGFSALTALITTAIAWYVQFMRTGG